MNNRRIHVFLLLFTFLLVVTDARAHDPGLSAAELRLSNDSLTVELSFAPADIESLTPIATDHNQQISATQFLAAQSSLEHLARDSMAIVVDGKPASCEGVTVMIDRESSAVRFWLKCSGVSGTHLDLDSLLLKKLARGHKQYLVVRDEKGSIVAEQMLEASSAKCAFNLQPVGNSPVNTFARFLVVGVEHILTGYDHLAFLFALLLAGSTLREVTKIITSFTLAHSISLALATFNILTISPAIVEPLIAISIVYVGCENLLRSNLNRRWLLTFGFGLIH